MSTRPEALRLADALDAYHTAAHHKQAAVELRRLHLVNAELLEALEDAAAALFDAGKREAAGMACAAIAKATGENT